MSSWSDETWKALFGVVLLALTIVLEMLRRAYNSGKADAERRQEEVKTLVKPVSNGFAEHVLKQLAAVLTEIKQVQDSQVDLHRRFDGHLEDHVPKQRRRWFR